ncbi:DUF2306 domain-containing protein [Nonomuraea sp. NPDC049480]|uniref:DUF2306 domain-containing protein n=1 Tax=Nonomuraea sp. NPDC049480 TaxID=3364353 RepID=UPI0037A32228
MTTLQRTATTRRGWLIPAGLLVLGFIPVVAGAVRLTELTAGADITPANERFFAMPLPVVLHIVSVTVYSVLGAFQFAPGFRRRRPGWHRAAGRVLVPSGLVVGLSGLWMTLFYALPAGDQGLLTVFRLGFGSAMVVSIVLGVAAIRRRDIARHRAWMTRGYAIGMGAGTQAVTQAAWIAVSGTPGELTRQLLLGAGWAINVAVAEWVIRRRRRPRVSS